MRSRGFKSSARYSASWFYTLLVSLILVLYGSTSVRAERLIDDFTLRSTSYTRHTFPVVNALPGDMVRIELTYGEGKLVGKGYSGGYGRCYYEGQVLDVSSWQKTASVEFVVTKSRFDIVTELFGNDGADIYTTRFVRVKVWLGRPDIALKSLTLSSQNLKCAYSIGNVPWSPQGQFITIALYYSSTPDASGIDDLNSPIATGSVKNGPGFKNQTATVNFPCHDFPLAPYGKTYIVAIFDAANAIPEETKANNSVSTAWSFVDQVPHIEDAVGWNVGAFFMRRWLQGDAAIASKNFKADLSRAESGELIFDDTTIKLDWVFDSNNSFDNRAAQSASWLISNFYNAKSDAVLEKLVRRTFQDHPGRTRVNFGDFSLKGSALHAQQINFLTLPSLYGGRLILDPLRAALGSFSFYLIPHGTAQRDAKGRINGEITSVGIYVGDEFEFGGDQYLGDWHINPPAVRLIPTIDFISIGNSHFSSYRNVTRRGRDIVILSDVRVIDLGQSIPFKFDVSNMSPK